MAEMSASSDSSLCCIICNRVTQAQKRVYFRNVTKEPLFSLKQLLTKHHSEERVLNCLKEPVVSCKGTCQQLIRNLSKAKLRLESLENEIVGKVRFEDEDETTTEGPCTPRRATARVYLSTPVRETLSRTLAVNTPSVSVSIE